MSDKWNTLKYNHREKSIKVPFVTYADTEHLLEKNVTCHNKPENISTMKVKKYTTCGCSFSTLWSFGSNENEHDHYRGKACMKNL